ncbi:hypothetical protein [Rossellomorea aquimaris]|uniref:hypothetical protein n=1 Tax=Rossellomorea aquimaris TaxID=189382 RepID=UPI0005C8362B|nr:hypothetical protein [Rossellomorea aquimaris]
MFDGNGKFHLRRLMMAVVTSMVILSLLGCQNDGTAGIDSEKAEAIAMEQFEKDVKEHNETRFEKISMDDTELLSKETHFSSDSKAWEITFNFKDGLTREDSATNSIAHYRVGSGGEIIEKSTSFNE